MTTFVDLFCGAGGSSTGLVEAGWELLLAANHDKIAISTHAANHPRADHLCADVSQYDMRRLPKARRLWASPICTEISPAGGRRKRKAAPPGQRLIEGMEVSDDTMTRTRATFWDVIRATEVWRYETVICENVVEALEWELFDLWREGMHRLGYTSQIVSASSAHLGGGDNLPAPQWRDRIYIVFVRKGVNPPDLAPRPLAHCNRCGDVEAVQSWRNGRKVGKYRQQYDYRCPECQWIVDPYVRPASSIIDWSNLGQRIGDRAKPLAAATMARIRAGLDAYPADATMLTVNHSGHEGRAVPADRAPLSSRTAKIGDGILVPSGAFYVKNYSGRPQDRVRHIGDPLGTVTTKRSHSLVVPPQDGSFVVTLRRNGSAGPVSEPVSTVSAGGNHHGLVVPYRRGSAKPASDPMLTLGTATPPGSCGPLWMSRTATSGWSSPASSCTRSASRPTTSSTATRASRPCRPGTPSRSTSPAGSANASTPSSDHGGPAICGAAPTTRTNPKEKPMATRKRKSEYVDTCLNCGYMLVREDGRVKHGDYGQTWQRCSDRPEDAEALEFNGEGEHRRA